MNTTKKLRALIGIADKSQLVREGLSDIIRRDGRFDLAGVASNGAEFLKLAEAQHIDIGIIGWSFPDLNGGEILKELKRRNSKARMIIYSGETGDGVLQQAIRLGAWGFASKRAEPAHLLDIVAAVARGHLTLPYIDLRTLNTSPLSGLTERERELLAAVAKGLTNRQIADRMGITHNTVKYHLKNLYDKLDVSNRAMAVALYLAEEGPDE